jgi:hypothetical protein
MSVSHPRVVPGTASAPAAEPKELSNYRLLERLREDELANVYCAMHQTLDRPVEIHILRRTDWISASRFQHAGRLAARLQHPNILPVIDAGRDPRYGDYLVTPRIEGRPLSEVLLGGPLDAVTALRYFAQIGAALDYLHSEGIIHRDVQPANIIITPQGSAFLTNLSLADAPDMPDLSELDAADVLSPYAAPEESLKPGGGGPAQDRYGLGATLYHMLAGEPPVPGEPLRALAEDTPEMAAVDRVIRRLMSPDPAQRYESAAQAAAALRQALRKQIDDSTEDMTESRWEPVAEWLDNPLELVLGDSLDHEFISRSRARADGLHRVGALRRQLDRWSRQGMLRRPALGQLVQPEQIVSYNIYLYELRVYYETRTPPQVRERPLAGDAISPFAREMDLWEVAVPETEPFTAAPAETIVVTGSERVIPCTACNGATQVTCETCGGRRSIERRRRVKGADGQAREESYIQDCPTCRGYGKVTCARCEGSGQMLEEKFFTWSRYGRIYYTEDDLSGLHKPTITAQAQDHLVFHARIDPQEPRWYQVAPLRELMEEAMKGAGEHTRLLLAELTIRGVPVTEVDYRYRDKPRTLSLVGFKDEVRGDVVLYDVERIVLYVAIALMALVLIALVLAMGLLGPA